MGYGSYERIERLRDDLKRAKKRKEEADLRVKNCEARLHDAENNQIIAEVNALKLTPEQVAKFLQMAAQGEVSKGMDNIISENNTGIKPQNDPMAVATFRTDEEKTGSEQNYDYDESEDTEDEEI